MPKARRTPSAQARKNPFGTPAPAGVTIVRIGVEGQHTHVLDTRTDVHLCRSGIKHDKVPTLYASNAKFITCYRCQKLLKMNLG